MLDAIFVYQYGAHLVDWIALGLAMGWTLISLGLLAR